MQMIDCKLQMHIYHNLDEQVELKITDRKASAKQDSSVKTMSFMKSIVSKVITRVKDKGLNEYLEASDEEEYFSLPV